MKNYLIIGLIAAVAVLLFFLLQPEPQHDTGQSNYKQLKIDNDTLNAHLKSEQEKNSSLTQSLLQADVIITDLQAAVEANKTELNKSKCQALRLAAELKQYKDTTAYGRKVDSLVAQVENLAFLLTQYEQATDSLTAANIEQRQRYDTLLNERNRVFAELRGKYERAYGEYLSVFDLNTDMRKDLKRERVKTKIAAVLALVGAGLFIAK